MLRGNCSRKISAYGPVCPSILHLTVASPCSVNTVKHVIMQCLTIAQELTFSGIEVLGEILFFFVPSSPGVKSQCVRVTGWG